MALKQRSVVVLLAYPNPTEPIEHTLPIILGDQMRGELVLKQRGRSADDQINIGAACAWASAVRHGLFEGDLEEFGEACLAMGKPDDQDEDGDDVPPTPPAVSTGSA